MPKKIQRTCLEEIRAAEEMRNEERNSLQREVLRKVELYVNVKFMLRNASWNKEVKLSSAANNSAMSSATICCSGSISSLIKM